MAFTNRLNIHPITRTKNTKNTRLYMRKLENYDFEKNRGIFHVVAKL